MVCFYSDGGLHVSHEPVPPLHSSVSNSQDDATSLRCQLAETVPLLQPLVKLGPGFQVCEDGVSRLNVSFVASIYLQSLNSG